MTDVGVAEKPPKIGKSGSTATKSIEIGPVRIFPGFYGPRAFIWCILQLQGPAG